VVKAINKRCSKDLQAVVDGYCKFWVKARSTKQIQMTKAQNPKQYGKKYGTF